MGKNLTTKFICCSIGVFIACCQVFTSLPVTGAEIVIDSLDNGLAPGWEEKIFEGRTRYEFSKEKGRNCIKASSNGSASGLYYKINYNLEEYPIISWSWTVDHILAKGDARTKKGDDYAARLYIVFPSLWFWKTKAINYVWANKLPKGDIVPNTYTDNAMMIAVESGSELTGGWVDEKRNVLEDYKRSFGHIPNKVGAIAIMTDTDNTQESASACYGQIKLMSLDHNP